MTTPTRTGKTTPWDARPTPTLRSGPPQRATRPVLLLVGEGRVDTHPLDVGAILDIGRDATCAVSLPHPKISRHHARIQVGAKVEIEDLGSTNGIRLNGARIPAGTRAEMRTGDSFQIGPYVCVLLEASRDQTVDGPARAAIQLSDPTPNA